MKKTEEQNSFKRRSFIRKYLFNLHPLILLVLHPTSNLPPSPIFSIQNLKTYRFKLPHFYHPGAVSDKIKSPQSLWQDKTQGCDAAVRACPPGQGSVPLTQGEGPHPSLCASAHCHHTPCGSLAALALQKHWVVL